MFPVRAGVCAGRGSHRPRPRAGAERPYPSSRCRVGPAGGAATVRWRPGPPGRPGAAARPRRRPAGPADDAGLDQARVGQQRGVEEGHQVGQRDAQAGAGDGGGGGLGGVPQPGGRSWMPAPLSTRRRIAARAPGWTRSDSGRARAARTTWLSRNGACRRWLRISAACSRIRWSAAPRARAARARASPDAARRRA